MSAKISIDLVKHRLNQAKENLEEAKILYSSKEQTIELIIQYFM